MVFGLLPELPYLPELPGRGPGSDLTGRACAVLAELAVDLQPAGWRLVAAPGLDQRRARSLLRQDLDALEEVAAEVDTAEVPVKLQVCGPWTLAATVELPRGGRVLGDHGARRELAQSLAEGLREHVAEVRRRVSGASLVLQFDEPALPSVLAGSVPTASGYSSFRPAEPIEVLELMRDVIEAVPDVVPVVHCCARDVPVELLTRAGARAIGFDLSLVTSRVVDELAVALEGGTDLFVGAVPSLAPTAELTDTQVARDVMEFWRRMGFADDEATGRCVITPSCGLAGADPAWARTAMTLSRLTAHVVGESG